MQAYFLKGICKIRSDYVFSNKRFCSTAKGTQSTAQEPWMQNRVPIGHWKSKENQMNYMNWLSQKLDIKSMEDWYKISHRDIMQNYGKALIEYSNNSFTELIANSYPNYNWLPWKFKHISRGFWNDEKNVQNYMKWLSQTLNINSMEDWYKVSTEDIQQNYGKSLLEQYNNSNVELITSVFPNYQWLPWKFLHHPRSYWRDLQNQRKNLDLLAKELNFKEMNDWYKITGKDLEKQGLKGLLDQYSSLFNMFQAIYPEHKWDFFQFSKVPNDHNKRLLDDNSEQREYVKYLEKKFNINQTNDWYNVTSQQLREVTSLDMNSAMKIIKRFYPELNLKKIQFITNLTNKSPEFVLKSMLFELFPSDKLVENYKQNNLDFEFYFPDLKLALEFQGDLSKIERVKKAKEEGITLIQIPSWWDRKITSLRATIGAVRSDLLVSQVKRTDVPIPTEPITVEEELKRARKEVSRIFMLATTWNKDNDPTGWWMTEKYDGIRVLWTGTQLYTRLGNVMRCPEFFTAQLPPFSLDGELWVKKGLHQASVTLTLTQNEKLWRDCTFCIFDVPDQENKTYEERTEFLKNYSKEHNWPSFLHVIDVIKCEGKDHLEKYLSQIVKNKGEGVMLRAPGSTYEHGRSPNMRKCKEYVDTEVRVITNKYPFGMECEQQDGQVIFVTIKGGQYMEEAKKVEDNSVITVNHSGVNAYNKLIQPIFMRIRSDVTWSDIMEQKNNS